MKIKTKKIISLICLIMIILSTFVSDFGILATKVFAATATVTYNGKSTYSGSTVGDFSVNGGRAFCMEHKKTTPPGNTEISSSVYDNENIAKCLYYGYEGVEQWSGFTSKDMGIVITSLALDYFQNNNTHNIANGFIDYVNSKELPKKYLNFSNSNLVAYKEGDNQRTEEISLDGDSQYSISFELQSGVTLHNVTKGTTGTGNVTINGGDRFYFSAPSNGGVTGSWTSSNIDNTCYKYSSIVWVSSNNNYQKLVQKGDFIVDPGRTINLSIQWLSLGGLTIEKKNSNGDLLSGVSFKIWNNDGYSTTQTTEDGKIVLNDLTPATYYIQEQSTLQGYTLDNKIYEVQVQAGVDANSNIKSIVNKEQTGKIKFRKVNENGDGLANVEFELYADEDIKDVLGKTTYYTKDQKIRSITTDSNGVGEIDELKPGKYYLKEFATVNGYLKDNSKHKFTIDCTDESVEVIFVDVGEFINYEPSGKITVTKTNKNGDLVPNSKFLVTAGEDIVNKAGTVTYFHKGDEVGTIENTSSGTGTLENLHLGKYIVTETSASKGYLLNKESKEVELNYADENTSVVFDSTTIINDEPTGILEVKKSDVLTGNGIRPDGTYHHGDATFAGAEYTLYASENITNYAKTVTYYNKDEAIAKFTFDVTGTPTVKIIRNADGLKLTISGSKLKGLPMGSYNLKETKQPKSGYLPDTTTYNFKIDYIDQDTKEIEVSQVVNEQVERAKFELIKVSTDMNQVAPVVDKAQFTAILEKYVKYYGSFDEALKHTEDYAEDEWCTFETGLDGHGISNFLAYGKYVVSETYVPDSDINRVEEFTVTIDQNSDGVLKEVIANDSPFTAYIKMVKKDKKTGKIVTFSNATFELYKYDRATREWNLVQCKVGSKYYREWTTDSEGRCETETQLDAGTYRLVEKKIPEGFNELEENLIFYVNSLNETVEYDLNWDAWITVEALNEQPTGRLVVDKSIALREDIDKSIIDTSDLSSIKFRLKANEDIIDFADGSVIYKKGKTIGEYNVDTNGHLEIPNLPMGKYTLQEISFLDGTVINNEVYEINFEKTDNKTKEYVIKKDIENDTTLFEIDKTDITGENEVEGAKLQVIDEDGNVIDEWISKKKPHTIEGLVVDHEYTLREELAADGYVKATDAKFIVKNTSEIQMEQMKDEQVIINKVNIDKEPIKGAKLQVIDEDGNVVDSWTTDENVHYVFNLEEGRTYTLQEIEAPEPYVKAADTKFTVPSDKTNLEIELVDKKVAILKVDVNGNPVKGAELFITDNEGNIIDEWTSNNEEHYIKGLEENKQYKIYEKIAPEKYVLLEERTIDVTSEKETQIIRIVNEQVMVKKTDIDGNILKGAKLQVIDEDGNVVDSWTTDENVHYVSNLEEGRTYTLQEIEAPEPYVKAADTEFTVPNDGTNLEIMLIDKLVEMSKIDIAGEEVEGAELKVVDKDGNVIDSWTSTNESHKIKGLVEGETYTIYEEYAPDGYVISNSVDFSVSFDKKTQELKIIDKQVEISKIDIAREEVEGATLVVTSTKTKNIVDKWVSTKEPHKVNGLIEGETYILTEEIAPDGFVKAASVEFMVTREKETQKIELTDKRVIVKKTDFVTGEELEGAELEITDKDGNVIDSWTSSKEEHFVTGLVEGETYTLTEKSCPYGYEMAESIDFIVSNEKETQVIEMKDQPILKDIKIIKVDSYTKEVIKDKFLFGIYEDSDCTKLIREIKSNKREGSVIFEDLRFGTYYIKELQAPKGYELSEQVIKVEINENGIFIDDKISEEIDNTATFKFENKKIEVPQTGDNSHIKLALGILILSTLGLAYLVIKIYKSHKENKNK